MDKIIRPISIAAEITKVGDVTSFMLVPIIENVIIAEVRPSRVPHIYLLYRMPLAPKYIPRGSDGRQPTILTKNETNSSFLFGMSRKMLSLGYFSMILSIVFVPPFFPIKNGIVVIMIVPIKFMKIAKRNNILKNFSLTEKNI